MKRIILKRMTLLNFKGIRSFQADFAADVATVLGRNGTGKTTLFDAFTWVLFGKDSRDRKTFEIKTLDSNNNAIPKLPHEVSVVLDVDGQEISLTRRYNEKWVKRRGSAVEEFTGHEEERLYNDVPCSLKEWNDKIADICPELVFKFITSPTYFSAQKTEAQREMLIRMVGGFSDNEVVAASGQRADFIELLGKLCGKTIEEYRREIGAKKKRIKAELDALPERIDERRRDSEQYAAINYQQIELEIAEKQNALADIERQLSQTSARVEAMMRSQNAVIEQIQKCRSKQMELKADKSKQMLDAYYAADKERIEMTAERERLQQAIKDNGVRIKTLDNDIKTMSARRETLRNDWKRINAMQLTFAAGDFVCPTCGQQLDPDNIEKKQAEMTANFNADKAARLKAINDQGQTCSASRIDEMKCKLTALANETEAARQRIAEIDEHLEQLPIVLKPTDADVRKQLEADEEYQKLVAEDIRLSGELGSNEYGEDAAGLDDAREMLADSIAQLKAQLEGRVYMERNSQRIAELETQLKAQAEELARLEGIEFTIADFAKARIEAVENKINVMFSLVTFKMYAQQINGGEVETCEAMVDGVPYSNLNNAMRINAGLDIINAICRHQGICAPIFIDNAEGINEPMPTDSQQVRLYVNGSDKLIVK